MQTQERDLRLKVHAQELGELRLRQTDESEIQQEKEELKGLKQQQDEAIRSAQWFQERARSELQAQIKRNQDLNSKLCNAQANAREKEMTMSATIDELQKQLKNMAKAFGARKIEYEQQMKQYTYEKQEAISTKDKLTHVQTQWANYERKLNDKRELLVTYEEKLKQVESEHLGCIEVERKARKEIDALSRVVTVETTKHLEKDTLARKLQYEKISLETTVHDLRRTIDRIKDEQKQREMQKKARKEK